MGAKRTRQLEAAAPPADDTLANLSGRGWLADHLREIAFQRCPELLEVYRRVRGRRTGDRQAFADAVEALAHDASLVAVLVRDGTGDIREVTSILARVARLDHAIHGRDLLLGRAKAKNDAQTEFGEKDGDHVSWAELFDRVLPRHAGARGPRVAAAKEVRETLGIKAQVNQILRAINRVHKRGRPPG